MDVVEVLADGEQPVGLARLGRPIADIPRQAGDRRHRAAPAPRGKQVADRAPLRAGAAGAAFGRARAEQVGNVGDDPVRTGFDETVVVHALEVAFDRHSLAADDAQQLLQDAVGGEVAPAN